jgi:hypothetical protein
MKSIQTNGFPIVVRLWGKLLKLPDQNPSGTTPLFPPLVVLLLRGHIFSREGWKLSWLEEAHHQFEPPTGHGAMAPWLMGEKSPMGLEEMGR